LALNIFSQNSICVEPEIVRLIRVSTMVNATEDENNGNRLKAGKQAFAQSIHYPVPGVRTCCLTASSVSLPWLPCCHAAE